MVINILLPKVKMIVSKYKITNKIDTKQLDR